MLPSCQLLPQVRGTPGGGGGVGGVGGGVVVVVVVIVVEEGLSLGTRDSRCQNA